MSSRTTLTISGIDLKYVVAQYTSQLAGNGASSRGASSCVGGAVAVWVTEDPHGWRADVSAPAATGGERLRLRSSSPMPDAKGPLSTAIVELLSGRRATVVNFPVADTDHGK